MTSKLFSLIAICAWAVGCGGEGEKATPATSPNAAAPVQAPAAPAVVEAPAPAPVKPPTADELPVPEDFEAQVEGAISAKNYKAQFAQIDHEIEKDCAQ